MQWLIKWGVRKWLVGVVNTALRDYADKIAKARLCLAVAIAKVEAVTTFLKALERKLEDGTLTDAEANEAVEEATEILRLKAADAQLGALISRRESVQQRLRKLEGRAARGLEAPPLLLGGLEEVWRSSPRRRQSSAAQTERYASQLRQFVAWAGEKMDLRAVDDACAERYAQSLASAAGSTFNKHLNTLTAVWKAVGRSRGLGNPWADLPRRPLESHVRRPLTDKEIKAVLAAAEGEWRALILIGSLTGLRLGDACRLTWEAFGDDGILRVKTSKTGAEIALPCRRLMDELTAVLGKAPKKGSVIPNVLDAYRRDSANFCRRIERIFRKAGLTTSVKAKGWSRSRPDASYHSLRHTFVTRAIERGVPAPIVRALVGHATAAMTDRYSHISAETMASALSKAGLD